MTYCYPIYNEKIKMFRRRKFFRRRKTGYNRRRTFKRFVKKVRKATTAFAEKKYRDFGINAAVSTTGVLLGLTNAIPTGNSNGERIGNKIRSRYCTWRLSLFSTNEDLTFIRVALLRGRTAGLTIGDLPSGTSAESTMIDIEKWEVISDKVFSLGDSDTDGRNKVFYRRTIKMFKDITYDSNVTGTGITNPYFMWIWTSDVLTTSNNVVGTIRNTYVDI